MGRDQPGPTAGGGTQAAVPPTVASTLGEMVWLLTMSPLHRHLFLSDLEWTVMPAILLGQYKLFRAEGRTAGVALWAYLNEEAEARLLEPRRDCRRPFGLSHAAMANSLRVASGSGRAFC